VRKGGEKVAELLLLQVQVGEGADDDSLAESLAVLSGELSELDVHDVGPQTAGAVPTGAKGIELLAVGTLLVKLGRSSKILREVVGAVRDWMDRSDIATVKMVVDGDVLEITGASDVDVKALVDAFVKRHGEA
jgi:hypothetical protein